MKIKFLALLMSVAMLIGMIPITTSSVDTVKVNGVTLIEDGLVISPAEILDNVVVYDVIAGNRYTLTTTDDNTYGVFFRAYMTFVENKYNPGRYDVEEYDVDIILDNVTIKAYNPRHEETEGTAVGHYGALMFWGADLVKYDKDYQDPNKAAPGINLCLKGENNIELLGVENDSADIDWGAVVYSNCFPYIYSETADSVLNATVSYSDAVGGAAAISTSPYSVQLGAYDDTENKFPPVTINATAQVTGVDGTKYGDGIVIHDAQLFTYDGLKLNITAEGVGINRKLETYSYQLVLENTYLNINAGKAAIINEGTSKDYSYSFTVFYDCVVNADGIRDEEGNLVTPLQSGINSACYIIFENTPVNINAVDAALNAAYDLGGNQGYNHKNTYVSFKNSKAVITGSVGGEKYEDYSNVYAINTDSYYSGIYVRDGSSLTVNAGYHGLCATTTEVSAGSTLKITTTERGESYDGGQAVGGTELIAHNASGDLPGAKIDINAASDYIGVANIYLYGGEVNIKVGKTLYSPNYGSSSAIKRYNGVNTYESRDGINWQPFVRGINSAEDMSYFTTVDPETHICANDDKSAWTKSELADIHTATCILCGAELTKECEYEYYNYYPTPTAQKDGKITYRCQVSSTHYKYVVVPAHNCADYISEGNWEDYGNSTKHKGDCEYLIEEAGIPCGNSVYTEHNFTDWAGDSLTVSRTCTECGFVESKNTHENVTHMEAIEGDCSNPGRIEFWHCTDADCGLYFSDAMMTNVVSLEETFTIPGPHSYDADGVCTVCGHEKDFETFVVYGDDYFSSDMVGKLFIFVGFKDGKAYVMGNKTNPDGSREAIEIPVKANGAIDIDSETAEFFAYDWNENTFSPDNGYMSMYEGKIIVYDKERVDEDGLPGPIRYSKDYYYSNGGYFLNWTNDLYIVFDAETLTFKVSDTYEDSVVPYAEVCDHENIFYVEGAKPTCTEQGAEEYWYCGDCYNYYQNGDLETPVTSEDNYISPEYFTIPALCHRYNEDGICENCGMKRPVYKPVTSLEQFDALSENAYYIIVFKDGEKTYAAYNPNYNYFKNPCETDSDGDGLVDAMEQDGNANGLPDCIEKYIDEMWGGADLDENGVTTVEEYNEIIGYMNEDDVIDIEDYKLFFEYNVQWELSWKYEEEFLSVPNFVEVTLAEDGSITITDEKAMEFQMMDSGVWGSQPNEDWMLEEYGITENDRLRAVWIPNYWVGASGQMGYYSEEHFMHQYRYYGDDEFPGIIDHKNWKISFREDGTACLVNTWESFDDTGAFQMVKYVDEFGEAKMTIFGTPEWLWDYSEIMLNRTDLIPAYLYAAEPEYDKPIHTCDFGDWIDDENGDTHTRTCKDSECGKTETKPHDWDDGVQAGTPTCTEGAKTVYTCGDCGATYEDDIDNLGHDWGDWTDDGENSPTDTHSRTCKRNCGVAAETENHSWSRWTPVDDNTHKKTCSTCNATRTAAHNWAEGVVAKEPTEFEEGLMTYTCGDCAHTKGEPIEKLEHVHNWSAWEQKDDTAHIRSCRCNETQTENHNFDDGVVINWATHLAPGEIHFTCIDCGYIKIDTQPPLEEHEWGEWVINKLDEANTHIRFCICNESQTSPHDFDAGVVTTEPTHTSKGVKTFACGVCGHTYTEDIPKISDHEWTDWSDNGDGTHSRYCRCNASETADHAFDEGKITIAPTVFNEGEIVYTCGDCGATMAEALDKLEGTDEIVSSGGDVKVNVEEGSTAVIDPNTELIVEEIADPSLSEETLVSIVQKYGENSEIVKTYDITMMLDGLEVQPGGVISVTIPCPEGMGAYDSLQVVYVDEFGNVTPCETIVNEDGTITFKTDHFSYYAIIGVTAEDTIKGDVDFDGYVNSRDLFRQKLIMLGVVEATAEERSASDINGDGLINANDIFQLSFRILYGEWI